MLLRVNAVLLALLTSGPHVDQTPIVILRMHNAASLTLRELIIAKDQVDLIWSREGIQIRWNAVGPTPSEPEIGIDVMFDRSLNLPHVSVGGTFALAFAKICQPEPPPPAITVMLSSVEQFVTAGMSGERPGLADSVIIHQMVIGRVVGRSIAHEIGHVLLRSHEHAREGLMRPHLTTTELFAENTNGFRLTAHEHEELRRFLLPADALPSMQCDGLVSR